MGFRLHRLEVRETDTSTVVYTRADWVADNRYFAVQRTLPAVQTTPTDAANTLHG